MSARHGLRIPRPVLLAVRRVAGWLCLLVPGGHSGRCGCPPCNHTERNARVAIGMAVRHPERITRELAARHEEWLATLATDLWPDDEYADIITELHREEGQP
jgi:hypothetical protein